MKFSVLIPAYNRHDTVGVAVSSVLAQGRPDVEIVAVDDASTDETARVLESFGDRIRLLRNSTNLGHAMTWGKAIRAARGQFLVKLDADDWLLPGYFEAVATAIDDSVGMVIPSVYDYLAGSDVGVPRLVTPVDIRLGASTFRRKLLGRIFFRTPGMALRRSLTLDWELPTPKIPQDDWEYLLRTTRGAGAALLSTPLAVYRIHQSSISGEMRARTDGLKHSLRTFASLTRDPGSEAYLSDAERRRFMRGLAELYLRIVGSSMSLRDVGAAMRQISYACGIAASEDPLSIPLVATFPFRAILERALLRTRLRRLSSPIETLLPPMLS
jgi:glycosyltransferase involved in cell wall biosynthesis